MIPLVANAADYPAPKEGNWIARDFRFHTGEVLPEIRLHYRTIGKPEGIPVVVLHGTGSSGVSMLTPAFAGELFGPGQPLDAEKYFIILPDALGHGNSTKPSDGLKTKFPQYNYADMVDAQYRLVAEGLGIKHAHGHRQFDGRHECLAVGREISRLHGHSGADGVPTHRNGIA
jgi:homoserine O-acetyltransferase